MPHGMREVRAGDAILARDHNDIVRAVAALSARGWIRAGFGRDLLLARVTAVQGADGDRARDVTYSARPIGLGPEAELVAVEPRYNRPFRGARLEHTARVGDVCLIVRAPEVEGGTPTRSADLWMLTEVYREVECEAGPALRTGLAAFGPPPERTRPIQPPAQPPGITVTTPSGPPSATGPVSEA